MSTFPDRPAGPHRPTDYLHRNGEGSSTWMTAYSDGLSAAVAQLSPPGCFGQSASVAPAGSAATQAAIWVREEKPSFARMCATWLATVGLLI